MKKEELELIEIGFSTLVGIDEAGRGPGAWDLVVSGVILPIGHKIEGLKDSKKCSKKQRNKLYKLILERSIAHKIVAIPPEVIDRINVNAATKIAIEEIATALKGKTKIMLIDGNMDFGKLPLPYINFINGEDRSDNIAAASILSKVWRDNWIECNASQFPEYGFDKHKGYLTKQHIEALEKYGPCPVHRMSYTIKGKRIGDFNVRS